MYKLFLTLENEAGNKIERVMQIPCDYSVQSQISGTIEDMIDSIRLIDREQKEEELKVEADRLTQHND